MPWQPDDPGDPLPRRLIQLDFGPLGTLEPMRDSDPRLDPNYLVTAAVGVRETKQEERAHVRNGSIACALGNEAPPRRSMDDCPSSFLAIVGDSSVINLLVELGLKVKQPS